MVTTYKTYRSDNPETLGELIHESDSLEITLTNQPHGKHYYKFTATNEYGTSRPSIAYEGVSVQPGGAISFTNGVGKVTLNGQMLTGADTLHLEGRNTDNDAWAEIYTGTGTTHEVTSAVNMYKQWRYYGTYGEDFMGDASTAAIYTTPSISAATLAYTTNGNNVTFTYTGGDGALIAELMSGSTVAGVFTDKSLTIAKPAANTTYFVRLRSGFAAVSSNMVTVVTTLSSITVDITYQGYTVPAGYTACEYTIILDEHYNGGYSRAGVYRNGQEMDYADTNGMGRVEKGGSFSVTGGDQLICDAFSDSGNTNSVTITLKAALPPIAMDITNSSYTVPMGYTVCYYEMNVYEGFVSIMYNGVEMGSTGGMGGPWEERGGFNITGGKIIEGNGQGDGLGVSITLT